MISSVAKVLVLLVALIHVAIAVTEIFLWESPAIHSRLGYSYGEAQKVAPIVANAGLYNGFLAAGLIWGLLSPGKGYQIKLFFSDVRHARGNFRSRHFEMDYVGVANYSRSAGVAGSLGVEPLRRTKYTPNHGRT